MKEGKVRIKIGFKVFIHFDLIKGMVKESIRIFMIIKFMKINQRVIILKVLVQCRVQFERLFPADDYCPKLFFPFYVQVV